ncbi:MAG: AAA family ATPase [Nitrososphaerota archaeon]|nr:AAA family ATPase [Nitrososphaerota archaeon]MDG6919440.1 AAA family ATPase [Nitrososphaerota archaeon]
MKAAAALERLKTGVEGLDELVEGGLMRGDIHLLAGGPGTGKTVLCANIAYNAASAGENVVYATFEESADYFKRNARLLGIEFAPLEKEGKIEIVDLEALKGQQLETNLTTLVQATKDSKGSLLVIDSITALLLACESQFEMRTFMKSVYNSLKAEKITTVMTGSLANGGRVGLEGFMTDSVMLMENWEDGVQMKTRFVILKMRGTNHSKKYHSVVFGPKFAISRF